MLPAPEYMDIVISMTQKPQLILTRIQQQPLQPQIHRREWHVWWVVLYIIFQIVRTFFLLSFTADSDQQNTFLQCSVSAKSCTGTDANYCHKDGVCKCGTTGAACKSTDGKPNCVHSKNVPVNGVDTISTQAFVQDNSGTPKCSVSVRQYYIDSFMTDQYYISVFD